MVKALVAFMALCALHVILRVPESVTAVSDQPSLGQRKRFLLLPRLVGATQPTLARALGSHAAEISFYTFPPTLSLCPNKYNRVTEMRKSPLAQNNPRPSLLFDLFLVPNQEHSTARTLQRDSDPPTPSTPRARISGKKPGCSPRIILSASLCPQPPLAFPSL